LNEAHPQPTPSISNPDASSGCLPKAPENPKYEVKTNRIVRYIQYMQDHDFIGKFMGIWPTEKALNWWIKTTWKPKGQIDLKLGSKGFFTVIFSNLEERDKVFENGLTFSTQRGYTFDPGLNVSPPKRKILLQLLCGSDSIPSLRNSGTRKFLKV
jgi:hypothetical protein